MSDKITTEQMQGALSMLLLKEREHLRKNPTVHDYLKAIGSRLADYDALKARVAIDAETIKLNFETIDKAIKERDALKAEVERLNKRLKDMTANRDYWEDKADGTERDRAEGGRLKSDMDKWVDRFNETSREITAERDAAHSRERLSARAYGNLCSERDSLKARAEKAEAEVERLKKKLEGMTDNRNYWERESDKAALAAEHAAKEKP